jgi:hypothetical protein
MGDIQVVDNFLSTEELNKVLHKSENFHWRYGHSSTGNGIKFWHCNLGNDEFFTTHILKKIENYFQKRFLINKVYANGQTYGLDGSYHTDDYRDDCYTFLLYLTEGIDKTTVNLIDGHTIFKIDSRIMSVEPLLNRGVLFKSDILHKGMAPSRNSNVLRISVAFKLREIK